MKKLKKNTSKFKFIFYLLKHKNIRPKRKKTFIYIVNIYKKGLKIKKKKSHHILEITNIKHNAY